MAVRFAETSDLLAVAHGLTLGNGGTSVGFMYWFRRKSDRGAATAVLAGLHDQNDGSPTSSMVTFLNPANGDDIMSYNGGSDQDSGANASDVWLHVSFCFNGTTKDSTITVLDDSASTTPAGSDVQNNAAFDPAAQGLIYLLVGASDTNGAADMEFTSLKLITGLTFTNAELRTESQFFAKQKAGGTALIYRLDDATATTTGVNELGGAGPNLTNTGVVAGASRPGQLESLGGVTYVRPGISTVLQAVMRAATR